MAQGRSSLRAGFLVAGLLLGGAARAEVPRGVAILPPEAPSPELSRALAAEARDAIAKAGFVEDPRGPTLAIVATVEEGGCSVRMTLGPTDAEGPCDPAAVPLGAREALRSLLALYGVPLAIPHPPPPPPPPLPPDAWVFETGVNLETNAFHGLGHMVLGTDHTQRFRGALQIAGLRARAERFDGALELALGEAEAQRFRGGVAFGLFATDVDDFAGIAELGLRKADVGTFAGVLQLGVGIGEARRFAGIAQAGGVVFAEDLTALTQVGLVAATERSFTGGLQLGVVTYARSSFAGALQAGVFNGSSGGVLRGFAQIGVANFVEREAELAVQAGFYDLTTRFVGGVQIGFANWVGSKRFEDYFQSNGPELRADFEGGAQFGLVNVIRGTWNGGVEVGFLGNVVGSSFQGVAQGGLLGNWVDGNFEGVTQLGVANGVMHRFSGVAQIGALDYARRLHGAQIGLVNVADEVRGVQIGVVNRARTLAGVQIGLVNSVDGSIPVIPIVRLGL